MASTITRAQLTEALARPPACPRCTGRGVPLGLVSAGSREMGYCCGDCAAIYSLDMHTRRVYLVPPRPAAPEEAPDA